MAWSCYCHIFIYRYSYHLSVKAWHSSPRLYFCMVERAVRPIIHAIRMKLLHKGLLILGMLSAPLISALAEEVTTSSGQVVGSCTIESSEIKYDRSGNEVVWVKVKVTNNTGQRIRGTVYGNKGGEYQFIVDPYNSSWGYLDNCQEAPSYLICNNAN